MKGHVYYDVDRNLVYKTAEFIESDPGFAGRNFSHIVRWWDFNTEDNDRMISMFRTFTDYKVPNNRVHEFLKTIGFDLSKFKEELKAQKE